MTAIKTHPVSDKRSVYVEANFYLTITYAGCVCNVLSTITFSLHMFKGDAVSTGIATLLLLQCVCQLFQSFSSSFTLPLCTIVIILLY